MNCRTNRWCSSVNPETHVRQVCDIAAAVEAGWTAPFNSLLKENALGARVTAYYAIEQLQMIYDEGYMMDQKMIDGLEERARAAGQKRVDAIAKMAKSAGVLSLRW